MKSCRSFVPHLPTHRADYTHVIFIGTNELNRVVQAITRYALGATLVGPTYQDPVAFDRVFEVHTIRGVWMDSFSGQGCSLDSSRPRSRVLPVNGHF